MFWKFHPVICYQISVVREDEGWSVCVCVCVVCVVCCVVCVYGVYVVCVWYLGGKRKRHTGVW